MPGKDLGICCFCVNIRIGFSLICLAQMFYGMICLVSVFTKDIRLQFGGYDWRAGEIQTYTGILGLAFGTIGLLGVNDNRVPWIRAVVYFLFLKMTLMLLVFALDYRILGQCTSWAKELKSQIPATYNPALYTISMKGICMSAQLSYILGFGMDFGLNLYWTLVSYHYLIKVECGPAMLIRFDNTNLDDHTQLNLMDPAIGEPSMYLHENLQKPDQEHGHRYGAIHGQGAPLFRGLENQVMGVDRRFALV